MNIMDFYTRLRQSLPDEKFYLFINRWVFSLLFVCVGLPLWYSTTSTYRANLPYSRISSLANAPFDYESTNLTSFQTASSYEISFYLINNNDDGYQIEPKLFQEKISKLIVPYLKENYGDLFDFDISTEILFNTRGILPSETSHILDKKQIPFFINKLEHLLHRSMKHYRQKIYFILFAPDSKQSPIKIDQSTENSIIVPKWGSVIFYDKETFSDLNLIIRQFGDHFEELLSIGSRNDWIQRRTIENFNNGRQTLDTLSQLLQSIPNIVIDDNMAEKIQTSLDLLESCHQTRDYQACQKGRLLADQVFYDPSLLKLLYFPDDQKFAIYVPLYLPMGAPIAWTLFNDIKFLSDLMKRRN